MALLVYAVLTTVVIRGISPPAKADEIGDQTVPDSHQAETSTEQENIKPLPPRCVKNYCANGGECLVDRGVRFCKCKWNTRGERCQIVGDCELEGFCGTGEDVECVYDAKLAGGKCLCKDPSKSFNYIKKTCETITSTCTTDECLNGGVCNERRSCDCGVFTRGLRCEYVHCRWSFPKCEESGGQCKLNESAKIPFCDCLPPKVFHRETEQCEERCKEDTCVNGGWCSAHGFCICLRYTSGVKCEILECNNLIPRCKESGGYCKYNASTEYPYCECRPPKVHHKELERCEDTCQKKPCQNGGTCNKRGICECLPYTSGARCERIYCKSILPNCGISGGKCKYSVEEKYPFCECEPSKVLNKQSNKCEDKEL